MSMRSKFRPLPKRFRISRRGIAYTHSYARFYALYLNKEGKQKRASFQIKVTPSLERNKRLLHRLIVIVIHNMMDKRIPLHKLGETFPDFGTLLRETPWIKVRKLLKYEAGVIYEK